jgi:hypothetical protein
MTSYLKHHAIIWRRNWRPKCIRTIKRFVRLFESEEDQYRRERWERWEARHG